MTNKLLKSLVRVYDDVYTPIPYKRLKMVAFLIYKGKIVSFGVNSDRTSPMQKRYRRKTEYGNIPNFIDKEHAEINLLRRTYLGNFDLKKLEIVIISKKFDGTFRLARPCNTCMAAIKDFGIKKIWYTTDKNEIVSEFV